MGGGGGGGVAERECAGACLLFRHPSGLCCCCKLGQLFALKWSRLQRLALGDLNPVPFSGAGLLLGFLARTTLMGLGADDDDDDY